MGNDPDEPSYEYGDHCVACWAAGLTPLKVIATFAGIEFCTPEDEEAAGPIPSPFTLTQDSINPCLFEFGDMEDWMCSYVAASAGGSGLFLLWAGNDVFGDGAFPNCRTDFTNTIACNGEFVIAENGTGEVTLDDWSPYARDMLYTKNLNSMVDSKYERWPADNEGYVYRFANIITPMNIYVLYEPE